MGEDADATVASRSGEEADERDEVGALYPPPEPCDPGGDADIRAGGVHGASNVVSRQASRVAFSSWVRVLTCAAKASPTAEAVTTWASSAKICACAAANGLWVVVVNRPVLDEVFNTGRRRPGRLVVPDSMRRVRSASKAAAASRRRSRHVVVGVSGSDDSW